MKDYLKHDAWKIIEEGFHKEHNKISESIFSIGNGRFGQRANFEEHFSGETMLGNYVAGVYYPDKTRVGWWKNGYPEYFAKVLNAANWTGIDIEIDGEQFDLDKCKIENFTRVLDMQNGTLERNFTAHLPSGKIIKISTCRFCSMADDECAAMKYSITPINFNGEITITPYIDGDVMNEDSNYDEKFWKAIDSSLDINEGYVLSETLKTEFQVATAMRIQFLVDGDLADYNARLENKTNYIAVGAEFEGKEDQEIVVYKYVANVSSLNYTKAELAAKSIAAVNRAYSAGFNQMKVDQSEAWDKIWQLSDIEIDGDVAAQQGIRFNIFHLYQTYTGEDARLNIGPKGFTGEKYGGSTYWDTEAYCFPFYLATAEEKVARNLLIYRYKHLGKAIENAAMLGFKDGAALFPMVTMNGEECHNEWEITFEEIHRNGAIAYAVFDYINYTGDKDYLIDYGLELLIGISRFWAQRVHFSERKGMYVMHGVTGPNEYENNVNNNWYTSTIATWTLEYTLEALEYVQTNAPDKFKALEERIKFQFYTETKEWKKIMDKMFYPVDEELGIFLQQDGYMDKEQVLVSELDEKDRPLNQKWSWDRILRSCFIKQADVLQGIYFFEDRYDLATIERNFDFYEPRTVHESSLSPCVHVVLAAKLGRQEKAYEMYLRTSRLDLDDYNNDTEDGLHITSMAGTWLAVVKGFGGMRVKDGILEFTPFLPSNWNGYSFNVRFRNHIIQLKVSHDKTEVKRLTNDSIPIKINGKLLQLESDIMTV